MTTDDQTNASNLSDQAEELDDPATDTGEDGETRSQLWLRIPPDIKQSMTTLVKGEGITMRDLVIIEHLAFLEGPYEEVRGKLRNWVQQARERGVLPEPRSKQR